MENNLKLKDKLFIFIIAVGMLAFLYNKFFQKNDQKEPAKIINNQEVNVSRQENNEKIFSKEGRQAEDYSGVAFEEIFSFQKEIAFGKSKVKVWIADSDGKRYRGLSGKENISQDEGMLFVHSKSGQFPYVMREMNFDLDFVFILGDEVVDMRKNIPKDYSESVFGKNIYDKVLEISSGKIEKENILIGDKIVF